MGRIADRVLVHRGLLGLIAGLLAGLLAGSPTAAAGEPPTAPQLRIEAEMHTAPIVRIAVDAAERYLVTASADKTARVWDLHSGELLRVLRPPIGAGNEGKLYAVAIAPDGGTVAVGGWTGHWENGDTIYLFDRASGELTGRVDALPNVILHLAWSPDGQRLAAVLGAGQGLRVFDREGWDEVFRDESYEDASYWAEFDAGGRLLTSCYDGYLRLYDTDYRLIAKERPPGGERPFSARFSPDGQRVAVGFDDSTAVTLLSGRDLSVVGRVDTGGLDSGDLSKVAWSRDGLSLYAAGRYDEGGENPILAWARAGDGARRRLPGPQDTVMDLHALRDGGLAFGSADPAYGVIDTRGERALSRWPATLDFRGRQAGLRVSADGGVVEFGVKVYGPDGRREQQRAVLDLETGRVTLDPSGDSRPAASVRNIQRGLAGLGLDPGPADGVAGPRTRAAIRAFQRQRGLTITGEPGPALYRALGLSTLTPPRTSAPGLEVSDWYNSYDPKLNGKPLRLQQYEVSRGIAITPDARGLLLGTGWNLYRFDRDGHRRWRVAAPGTAWAVNVSGDGRHAVAAFGDGTVRWFRIEDGAEQLALFLHPDGERWVLWTPEGFFTASERGAELIGYHLNRGADRAGELVSVEQLYPLFYRPDLVALRLGDGGADLGRAELARIGDVGEVLAGGLPPRLEPVSAAHSTQRGRDFLLRYRMSDQGGGIGRVEYRVNGVTVGDPQARPIALGIPGHTRPPQQRPFTLSAGSNTIETVVYNAKGTIASAPLRTVVEVEGRATRRPALYGLAIGVTDYRDRDLRLKYAAQDAEAVANRLARQGRRLFSSVQVETLVDREVTEQALDRAFADLAAKAGEDDVFVLYLAGHGMAIDGEYRFILPQTRYTNQQALVAGSVGEARLQQWLAAVPARKSVMLLDTCQAGAFSSALPGIGDRLLAVRGGIGDKTAIDRLMRATGRATLAASSERQFALAGHEEHGVFTWALLRGLEGAASRDGDGQVGIDELARYVEHEVPRITQEKWGYEQFPMFQMHGNTFPLGLRGD